MHWIYIIIFTVFIRQINTTTDQNFIDLELLARFGVTPNLLIQSCLTDFDRMNNSIFPILVLLKRSQINPTTHMKVDTPATRFILSQQCILYKPKKKGWGLESWTIQVYSLRKEWWVYAVNQCTK